MGKVIFGPDYFILIQIAVPISIFYFQNIFLTLGLTKTSFLSNSLTKRVRQIWTLFSCILLFDIS
jgi:hypothetical protein